MATLALDGKSFDQAVRGDGIALVDFWAAWCAPCRAFAPVFDAASDKHEDIVFAKVDTEAEQELAMRFGIMSIPTLVVFRDGILVYSEPGALPAAALEELIAAVRGLDMEAVRKELETRAAS
jgi:thioredoxin 1